MKKVLFLNHKVKQCGVYQYGCRINEILGNDKTQKIEYIYREIDSYVDYIQILNEIQVNVIIYNYHVSTMNWLNIINIQRHVKNICICHESDDSMFDIKLNIDPTIVETPPYRYTIPRPVFENIDAILATPIPFSTRKEFIEKYQETNIPIFGSFGFGFRAKLFVKTIEMIQEQYDAAIIKFLIPVAHFGGNQTYIDELAHECFRVVTKPGIQLMITHDFFTNTELLQFLGSNTMNIFLYDTLLDRSISSTIDYALSVKKPLGISDSHMFRHIYDDSICLYKTPIATIMENSVDYCRTFLEKYSNENLRAKFREIIFSSI
jgi:hypothetical protein